jgi:hypothetical protein
MKRAQLKVEAQAVANVDEPTVTARDGASARLERTDGAEALTVRDRDGRLLFQYDSASGRGVLVMPEGDLCLAAPRGRIELVAAGGIRAISGGEIAIEGKSGVRLGVVDGASSMRVDRDGAAIEADRATIRARETDLDLGDTGVRAAKLHAAIDSAEITVGSLVRTAGRVVEQAESLYQRVTELCEIKAGRLRALVKESVFVKGDDVTLLADKDVRVDGEHIHLG